MQSPIAVASGRNAFREAIGLAQLHGMLRVDVQATGTSNHDQSRVSTGEDVREMLQRRGVLREGFRRPCAERVDDHIESGEICCGQVEQILDDGVLGDGFVLPRAQQRSRQVRDQRPP